jgi:quercetin dioxygenase-like cupin family protein
MAAVALIIASGWALQAAWAQRPGITRTDLQRHDLSMPGREVVQVRVDFTPGAKFGKRSHPGKEIVK